MIHFKFIEQDLRYLFLKGDNVEDEKRLQELKEYMSLVDPICYLPTYGNRPPIIQEFVYDYVQQSGTRIYYCSIGLWQDCYKFLKEKNYEFDGLLENKHLFKIHIKHTFDEFKNIVDSWNLKFTPRPYQYESAYKILQWNRSLSELATRAGKTLIAYIVFRYAMEYMGMKRILMVVPSISLVKQGYNDFSEYAEFFKTECIWAGGKLVESSNLTIGTFQSLIKFLDRRSKKYNPKFFDGYDCVFVDEVHRANAEQTKTIITQDFMKDVKIAFGMTGTLPKDHTIPHYCLRSLIGAKIQTIKPIELMNAGYISKIQINQIRLHYKDIEKQQRNYIRCAEYVLSEFIEVDDPKKPGKKKRVKLDNPEYQLIYKKSLPTAVQLVKNRYKEDDIYFRTQYIELLMKYIKASTRANNLLVERYLSHFMGERIIYLCEKILPICDKNTLILAHHTTYIKHMTEIIKSYFPNRHIEVITGSIAANERERIKQLMKENNDVILIASYGTMSTGITLSNLCYGVLFESFKSNDLNVQSLGRGLGLSDMKEKYTVFDIIDCFEKPISKALYLHGLAKIKIYKENQYDHKIYNVNI